MKVIAFGDSLVVGSKASSPERSWVGVLATLLREFSNPEPTVIRKGLGDNTISPRTTSYEHASKPSALERVAGDVVAENPDVVLVCFGLNDMRFGTPTAVFAEDLALVVSRVREGCPRALTVLTNVYHMTGFDRFPPRDRGSLALTRAYNAAIAEVARASGALLADVSAAMAFDDRLIHADGVHANDLGHRVVAHRVFETLAHVPGLLLPAR